MKCDEFTEINSANEFMLKSDSFCSFLIFYKCNEKTKNSVSQNSCDFSVVLY